MLKRVVYPPKELRASVGKQILHKPTGYLFKKSKNGKWGLVFTPELTETIRKLYVDKNKTLRYIADVMGVTHSVIQKLIDSNGWMRSKRERGIVINKVLSKHKTLKRMYLEESMSAGEIAEHFDIDASYLEVYFKQQSYCRSMSEVMLNSIACGNKGYIQDRHFEAWDYYVTLDITNLDYTQYKYAAYKLTNCVMYRYKHLIDPDGKRSHSFHIDHRLSVADAFYKICSDTGKPSRRNKVLPLYVLCHPANLKLMKGHDNHVKSARSSITVKRLKQEIVEFDRKHGEVF